MHNLIVLVETFSMFLSEKYVFRNSSWKISICLSSKNFWRFGQIWVLFFPYIMQVFMRISSNKCVNNWCWNWESKPPTWASILYDLRCNKKVLISHHKLRNYGISRLLTRRINKNAKKTHNMGRKLYKGKTTVSLLFTHWRVFKHYKINGFNIWENL